MTPSGRCAAVSNVHSIVTGMTNVDCSGWLTIVLCVWVILGISKSVLIPSLSVPVPTAPILPMSAADDDDDSTSENNNVDKRAAPAYRFVSVNSNNPNSNATFFHVERTDDDSLQSFAQVLDQLASGGDLMSALLDLMHSQASIRRAFFFECVPVSAETVALTPFQCAFVTSDALGRIAEDRETFSAHFGSGNNDENSVPVVAFANLGGDATLVVPTPADGADHAHLAAFSLTAQREAQTALWKRTATELLARVRRRGALPVWLSTSGLGVFYLHVRICDKPKYYTQKALTIFSPPRGKED